MSEMTAEQFGSLMRELGGLKSGIDGVRLDIGSLKTEVASIRTAQTNLADNHAKLDADVKRALELASEAKRVADAAVSENKSTSAGITRHVEKLQTEIGTLQTETESQSVTLASIKEETEAQSVTLAAIAEESKIAAGVRAALDERAKKRAEFVKTYWAPFVVIVTIAVAILAKFLVFR